MVTIINPNPFGPLVINKLKEFELENNLFLPEDYRSFLLKNNGGQPYPSNFWIQLNIDGSSVFNFFGIHEGLKHLSLTTYVKGQHLIFPKLYLPIADDGLGNFICIGHANENFGEIVFLDHDLYDFQNQESMIGISKISNSFSDFLNSLIDPPE